MKKPPRARAARRAADRQAQAVTRKRDRVAALEPGGDATWPIAVASTAVIERRIAELACARCAGPLTVEAHDAAVVDGLRRRVVRARCARCSALRTLWFEVVSLIEADN